MQTIGPPPTEIAARLRLAIARSARRLRQQAGAELTPSQTAALTTIERHGPLTPSELAQRERVQRPTVARMLGYLEETGMIERTAVLGDRRSSLVTVSDRGSRLLAEMRARKDAYLAERLAQLGPEDRMALDRAASILDDLFQDGGD
jgi:DNA-binding MarR family transcriptional regulator